MSVPSKLHVAGLRKTEDILDETLTHQIVLNSQACPQPNDLKRLQCWLVDIYGGGSQLRGPGNVVWFPPKLGGRPSLDHLTLAPTSMRSDNISLLGRKYLGRVLKWFPSWLVSVSVAGSRGSRFY